ncbi:GntR family transcriptional regulator [Rhodococcoides fascians]|uniref:GntR family transcriptional regulator n=1 Tax=Rhodococcoides fascians TaxID=1828 RepID=UPI00055E2663|nr:MULTISPECIES: GntR family transcriptional regulator [Rhodococcus]OZF01276.1 GntR family transcriptional regulator [Rhodococcus sp. 15-1189-1-1a]OZF15447.1 GntR family transcriptional regulator [Rhodococcus sp. 14-2686-1-2]
MGATSPLVDQIAAQMIEHIRTSAYEPGTRLAERRLAEELKVSRSPVRGALALLARDGIVGPSERGGYVVLTSADQLPSPPADSRPAGDQTYLQVARDRLDGELPDRITEKELARRYQLSRAELTELLRRMTNEGWIDRLPGYGWEFQPMLTSMKMYQDSYHFRLVIEPAAILEPTFVLDRPALEASRDAQQRLVDGRIWEVSNAELFDLNSHHHEVIIGCSRNSYYIDALKRIDRTRRLIEYRQTLQREKGIVRCREHVQIANLLLDGDNARASMLLYRHLATVSVEKTQTS